MVLKEYLHLWPIRLIVCPFFTLFQHVVRQENHDLEAISRLDTWKNCTRKNKSRAMLVHLHVNYTRTPVKSLGWCCLPIYHEDDGSGVHEWMEIISKLQVQVPGKSCPPMTVWDSVRIEKILHPFNKSKEFPSVLKRSLF